MSVGKQTFPVTKNGVFLGYADADQIAANPSLELYDERKADVAVAERKVAAAKAEKATKAEAVTLAAMAGADPAAVKKAPAAS